MGKALAGDVSIALTLLLAQRLFKGAEPRPVADRTLASVEMTTVRIAVPAPSASASKVI